MSKDYSSAMENPLGQRLRDLPGPLLLTGHTGFKGTWMSYVLEYLNVPVVGYSLPAEKDSLYDRAECAGTMPEAIADIRDYKALERFIDLHKPSTIIHMAAQPLVLRSYESPRETFDVNVMGTVNLLDIAFARDFVKAIIVVTTDKVYKNDNSGNAFVETDPLGGKDPYSASKVGTEAVVAAWQQISRVSGGPKLISVRAGNVIGGGDFAENRIVPDLIRSVVSGIPTEIRRPDSVRPWQHVIDPIVGYLSALENLLVHGGIDHVNFGPRDEKISVKEIAELAAIRFNNLRYEIPNDNDMQNHNIEAETLALNSDFAWSKFGWEPKYSQIQGIELTLEWWYRVLVLGISPSDATREDIKRHFDLYQSNHKLKS
jgi:CDP-glucose 4,6-dehydratase